VLYYDCGGGGANFQLSYLVSSDAVEAAGRPTHGYPGGDGRPLIRVTGIVIAVVNARNLIY